MQAWLAGDQRAVSIAKSTQQHNDGTDPVRPGEEATAAAAVEQWIVLFRSKRYIERTEQTTGRTKCGKR